MNLTGHTVFFKGRLALFFASEWAVLANQVTHCGYSCLPLEYKGLVQVLLFYFKSIFPSFLFWDRTIKSTTIYIKSQINFLASSSCTRKYILTKGPAFAGLARPSLTQNCRASGWWRSPKGMSRGWCLQPSVRGTVQPPCAALPPTTHSASEVCFPWSDVSIWGLSKEKNKRQWRRLYIKTWQKS